MTRAALTALLDAELAGAAPAAAQALAAGLAQRGGKAAVAVLYYGSALRAETLEGILDFYVLLDDVRAWPASWFARTAGRLLPPNVGYMEAMHEGQPLRAKYAVISLAQFARRVRPASLDTTIWARFCQPSLCLWSRSEEDRMAVAGVVADAVACAADWAARLGPVEGPADEYWRALFAHTYAAELRVEKAGRPQDIVDKHPERYARLLPLAWSASGIRYETRNGALAPDISVPERATARRGWAWRARLGRPLNILRLLKAAFTFDGAMDYAAWKIERHRGVRIEVAPWQRRFPLLAAPGLYLKLKRERII